MFISMHTDALINSDMNASIVHAITNIIHGIVL